jgi:uroporphyrinogen-III synthase
VKPRILITRPEPGASRTAARLAAAGFEPVVLPLTRIVALDFTLPDGPFEAVIVTSAQALTAVGPERILHLSVYAVGETTAESARSARFGNVMIAGGSVESIAALVRESAKPSARLLYLCGKVRRPELEMALGAAGFHLSAVETYEAVPVAYSKEELAARLGQTPFDAVTLMSAQAAELLSSLATAPQFASLLKTSAIICLSSRISDALRGQMDWKVCVTNEASENSMMECLSQRFS